MSWLSSAVKRTAGTFTFIGLSQLYSSYLRDKKLNVLVQFSLNRDPAMPGVPTIMEMAKNPESRRIFRPLVSNDEIGRSLFTAPNLPPERLAVLRSAFQAMIADPEFQADAQRLKLPLAPKSGEELQTIVNAMFNISPDALAKLRDLVK